MAGPKSYYITTPIYYVNDVPHIGHAYTTLACDVLARFKRLDGFNVKFLTGTDEHGQKVEKSAQSKNIDPQTFTDQVSQRFKDLLGTMNFSHDDFIRTTETRHKISAQAMWTRLKENGDIYLDKYAGWYSVRDEAFYTESELTKTTDGTFVAPTGAPVDWVEESSYFFRLSHWQERLLKFYDDHPDFIMPKSRRNEVISFVEGGLLDLSVSRTTFQWGIPVPDDNKHIMYVWLDALTNYITAVGFPDEDLEEFKTYWPADLHMVGKDILRFHAVYWPAFLMAAGIAPPKRVFAHGWWTNEGQKISKSVGNIIDPIALVEKYGLDAVRYFLMREVPFGNDGDFSHATMISRMNGELANDLGNLTQRVLSMVNKNCDAALPQHADFNADDDEILAQAHGLINKVRSHLDAQAFHLALEDIWMLIRACNGYVDRQAPWKLKKEDPTRMGTVLYVLCECIRHIAIILQPFMPDSMDKMLSLLNVSSTRRSFDYLGADHALQAGITIDKPQGVFPRFVEEEQGA